MGITQGDFNGVGPEVILKALGHDSITELFTPVIFADWKIIEKARDAFGLEFFLLKKVESAAEARQGQINVVDLNLGDTEVTPGRPTTESGAASVAALEAATAALAEGEIDVLVTAPISKEACQSEAFKFPGHTEYLNAKAGDGFKAQMILFSGSMRVALVTTHLPIAEVASAITREKVESAVRELSATLRRDFAVTKPKIAVLSLNPHVGDGGLLGSEEKDTITPAVDACVAEGIQAFGPYAADGFFGNGTYRLFDGIVAMYHDQGLAPFKALASETGVNYTAGLPWVRTSPDHGTAYDIAWKGEADPQSMREAIYSAIDIHRRRHIFDKASANPLKHHERPSREDRNKGAHKTDKKEPDAVETPAETTQDTE